MLYKIDNKLTLLGEKEECSAPYVLILTSEEYAKKDDLCGFADVTIQPAEHARFCKAERHGGILCGTFVIPKKKSTEKKSAFSYCITEKALLFVDDSGTVSSAAKLISSDVTWKEPSVGHFMQDFFEFVIMDDLKTLETIEDKLAELEESVLEGRLDKFNHKLMLTRKVILASSHYYSQLADLLQKFIECDIFSASEKESLSIVYERVKRLLDETRMLRELSMQLGEVYQAQIDIRQNQVMKILTIVTTVFLPLSLLVGWYGMNFKEMPELSWKYGYPAVILLSAAIVIYCMWIFKKKKFW